MQTTISERISLIINHFYKGKQVGLSKATGIPTSKISSWEIGKFMPKYDSLYQIIINHPTINIEWLMTGDGDMILSEKNNTVEKYKEEIAKLKEEIIELKKDKESFRIIAESKVKYGQ